MPKRARQSENIHQRERVVALLFPQVRQLDIHPDPTLKPRAKNAQIVVRCYYLTHSLLEMRQIEKENKKKKISKRTSHGPLLHQEPV